MLEWSLCVFVLSIYLTGNLFSDFPALMHYHVHINRATRRMFICFYFSIFTTYTVYTNNTLQNKSSVARLFISTFWLKTAMTLTESKHYIHGQGINKVVGRSPQYFQGTQFGRELVEAETYDTRITNNISLTQKVWTAMHSVPSALEDASLHH